MASNRQYISILSQAANAGNLTISLQSSDVSPAVSLSTTVAVATGDSEKAIAKRVADELTTLLSTNDALYEGTPTFSTEALAGKFAVTRTDHCVCIWSQCQFEVIVDPAPEHVEVWVGIKPILLTLRELEDYAAICGLDLVTADGESDLTTNQKALLAQICSEQTISLMNGNPIVSSPHLYQRVTTLTNSIRLPFRPVLSFDTPRAKRPGPSIDTISAIGYSKESFRLNSALGTLQYSQGSLLLDVSEPFAFGNELCISYTAGYASIPSIVKQGCVMLAKMVGEDVDLKSLKGADFAVEKQSGTSNPMWKQVKSMLGAYIL